MPIRPPGLPDPDHSSSAFFGITRPSCLRGGKNDQQFYQQEIPAKDNERVQLCITNLPAGSYTLEIYQTGYRANDVFTGYFDLGSPSQLTPAQVGILRRLSGDPPNRGDHPD